MLEAIGLLVLTRVFAAFSASGGVPAVRAARGALAGKFRRRRTPHA